MIVRPSGTEPKLKCYLEVIVPVTAGGRRRPGVRRPACWPGCATTSRPPSAWALTEAPDRSGRTGWPAAALAGPGPVRRLGRVTTSADVSALERARDLVGTSELTDAALRRFLHGLPGVDQVGAQARAADLSTRSIKTTAKAWAIDLAISMIDLTTLEGADTHGKVRSLCAKATTPDPGDLTCPRVAAICVYNDLVETAIDALREYGGREPLTKGGSSWVNVAAVATAFPSGRASQAVKLADTHDAVTAGADEVDMVIDRGAFLSGRYLQVFDEIAATRQACQADGHQAHLKVILELGELGGPDDWRNAAWLALAGGADFIKTSTGKVAPALRPIGHLVMLEAVRDFGDADRARSWA